jgi:DNA-binding CsgD family transcriptional regulator
MATENEAILRSIDAKLDQMLRLAALQLTSNMKQVQAIHTLSAAGFERRWIADLLGTTPGTVSVTLAKAKAKQKPREIPTTDPTTLVPAGEGEK